MRFDVIERVHYVHDAHLVSFKFYRINVHHDLSVASTIGLRNGRTGNVRNLVANRELRKVL